VNNNILNTDSYKFSHFQVLPSNVDKMFSYIESRGGKFSETVFFGLQYIIEEYISKQITLEDIDFAEKFAIFHGEPFNREGWESILKIYDGFLPVTIKAPKEGTVIPTGNVLVTIESEPGFAWLTSYIETQLLRVWYPITVATLSYNIKKIIKRFMMETCDNLNALNFKLHDFGARGVSSHESAMIGGASHIINFDGSDTIEGAMMLIKYYDAEISPSYSIPALEHSVITAYGKDNESECFKKALEVWCEKGILACVSDTYDIYNALENIWGTELKENVIKSGAIVVIRPDSGDPIEVLVKCLKILNDKFGSVINSKGYKVLNHVRLIQGDGINFESILNILESVKDNGFSIDNIAFGMGGKLLQGVDRDTQKFAMKGSSIFVNGKWKGISKDPVTDPGKRSKEGVLELFRNVNTNEFLTFDTSKSWSDKIIEINKDINNYIPLLETVYKNGKIMRRQTLNSIKSIISKHI
jgi:nicotinamide phosphoribosyltransferase